MHAANLRRLAFFLQNEVKDEFFNLATWVGNDDVPWGGMEDLSCGTTACAMGWATTIPEFKELGLRLTRGFRSDQGYIVFGEHKHMAAAAAFMDIPHLDAEYLFDTGKYPDGEDTSRMEVVARIYDYVENGMPEDFDLSDEEDEDE